MARPRSRLLDLERDDVFFGACSSDSVSAAVYAAVSGAILFALLRLAAGVGVLFPHAAAVSAVLYGAYRFVFESEALLGFLCWATGGALAARLGFFTGWKEVLHTLDGCEPCLSSQAATPPPSASLRAYAVGSTRRDLLN